MQLDWLGERKGSEGKYFAQSSSYSLNLAQFLKQKMLKKYLLIKANLMKFDIIKSKITCVSNLKGPGRIHSMNKSIKSKSEQRAINPIFLSFCVEIQIFALNTMCSTLHTKFYNDTVLYSFKKIKAKIFIYLSYVKTFSKYALKGSKRKNSKI